MPELPEVETICNALHPVLTGKTIRTLEFCHPRVTRHDSAERIRGAVNDKTISGIQRRGKFILMTMQNESVPLAIHLRMSGQLLYTTKELESQKHLRARFCFTDDTCLNFVDIRTFGTIFLADDHAPSGFLDLGIEPFSRGFTASKLSELFRNRAVAVKPLLLDQRLVAGIGNIYASESCFIAGIHPERRGTELSKEEYTRLHRSLRRVLRKAIRENGTTLSDFRRPDGTPGDYKNELLVYGREGEPCKRCKTTIVRIQQNGRSTFFCPRCQHTPGSDRG